MKTQMTNEELTHCLLALQKGALISIPISYKDYFEKYLENMNFSYKTLPRLPHSYEVTFRKSS